MRQQEYQKNLKSLSKNKDTNIRSEVLTKRHSFSAQKKIQKRAKTNHNNEKILKRRGNHEML